MAERGGERGPDAAAVTGQRGQAGYQVDGDQHVAAGRPRDGVLQRKQPKQRDGEPAGEPQGQQHRHAEQGLRGGQQELLDLARIQWERR